MTWDQFRSAVIERMTLEGHNSFTEAAQAVTKIRWGHNARFVLTGDGGRDTSWDGRGVTVSPEAWAHALVLCPGNASELHAAVVFDD